MLLNGDHIVVISPIPIVVVVTPASPSELSFEESGMNDTSSFGWAFLVFFFFLFLLLLSSGGTRPVMIHILQDPS